MWQPVGMLAARAQEPGGPDVLQVSVVETPSAGPGEVLVKVAAAGVNRADLLQRQGHYPPPPGVSDILGLECSGEIAQLGPGVAGWERGDACVALLAGGGYAEYVAVPAGQVVEPPDGVDRTTAAGLIEAAATVVSGLRMADLSPGEVFLVHGGSGGVGSFAIQYARAQGATVIATAGDQAKVHYCRSIGADLALSYRDDWSSAVRDFTSGHGVDVVLDSIGAKYLGAHVDLLATDGRLVVIGLQGGRRGELDLGQLLGKRGRIIATTLRSRSVEEKTEICRLVVDYAWPLVTSGAIRPAPQTVMRLDQVAEAHRQLESGDNLGKIILAMP
ncbi:MAG TPA: NAD(P)H-quinone oxidoreductase [Propionibacteriaceae bacterium]|nr:NAD(P)H-quinone oxidoreductase [Propionibacteriaceae bacterium]